MGYVHSYWGAKLAASLVNTKLVTEQKARLVCKSTVSEDEGKTVTINDGTNAYSGTFGSSLKVTFDVPGKQTYTIKVTNSAGTVEHESTVDLNNGDYKVVEVGLTTKTWTGIKNILNAHLESKYFAIGDTFSVELTTGENVEYMVAAINHDASHQLIFTPKNALETGRGMNSSNTNSGGWNSCAMRSYLNESFLKTLPSELQGVISDRTVKISIGSQSSSLQSATDKIWLPREYEVFGAVSYAASTEHSTGGAEQFPLFADAANRVKTYGKNGAAANWWLSSPSAGNTNAFCAVNASGSADGGGAGNTGGVCPCFQILGS